MDADNFADGDKNEHIVPDYNNDTQISTEELQEFFDEDEEGLLPQRNLLKK